MVDRLKRMINASGFKVWPAEVEALMYRHPAIQEACVIAAQRRAPRRDRQGRGGAQARPSRPGQRAGDRRLGPRPHGGLQEPAHRAVRDSLPKSGTGKVMWRELQEHENLSNRRPDAAATQGDSE
jgi:fatty-acyl-CoA synthase